jgi:intein/homing endonuclease
MLRDRDEAGVFPSGGNLHNRFEVARPLDQGMGLAVAKRTVFRPSDHHDMGRVADRVATGNTALAPGKVSQDEVVDLRNAIARGALITSGRHLQHGDANQPNRPQEVFTNCSTAIVSFAKFYLLLNGSGVGRSYDDELISVDWTKAPNLTIALSNEHVDRPKTDLELFRFANEFSLLPWGSKFEDFSEDDKIRVRAFLSDSFVDKESISSFVPKGGYRHWRKSEDGTWLKPEARENGHYAETDDTVYFLVPDSREGWGRALELYESMTFSQSPKKLVLDFSEVRPLGTPIAGMQDRPSSGPLSVMRAFLNVRNRVVNDGTLAPWEQAMHVDHYFSVEVQVGGARRAARMSTKSWRDPEISKFIAIKADNGLWTSNNSVMVDREFWQRVEQGRSHVANGGAAEDLPAMTRHALEAFDKATQYSYVNGEPGFINGDLLESTKSGKAASRPVYLNGEDVGSLRYRTTWAQDLLRATAEHAKSAFFPMTTNPCVTADTWVTTTEGARQVRDLINVPFTAIVDGKAYPATGFWKTGNKETVVVKTARGFDVRVTPDHKILVETGRKAKYGRVDGLQVRAGHEASYEWIEASALKLGDLVVLNNVGETQVEKGVRFDYGWLIGLVAGDGGYNPEADYAAYVRFWGDNSKDLSDRASAIIRELPNFESVHFRGSYHNSTHNTWQAGGKALEEWVGLYLTPKTKTPTEALEAADKSLVAGYLCGLFDTDGSVQGDVEKGRSIRLAQSNLETLKVAQRMLARFGILSTIYENRRPERDTVLPDGRGGEKVYRVKAQHELVISRQSMVRFADLIGFVDPEKAMRLEEILSPSARRHYQDRFVSEVVSVEATGSVEAVYDCTVSEVHRFDANGIIVHNCGEIELHVRGGYCVIADYAPLHDCPFDFFKRPAGEISPDEARKWDDAVERTVRLGVRFLMRVNLMDSLYKKEVERTNRIGIGFTGLFSFALARFNYGFHDLIDEAKSADFWALMSRFSAAAKDEAAIYAAELGVEEPHTVTTVKPAGCRPWNALTTTTDGLMTLQELFSDHKDGQVWGEVPPGINAVQDEGTRPITRTFVNGEAEVFRIRLAYGLSVESTANHPWWVKGTHVKGGIVEDGRWVQTKDIQPDMVLDVRPGIYNKATSATLKGVNTTAIRMRGKANPISQPETMNPDLAWLLGYLWGDGAMSSTKYRLRWLDSNLDNLVKVNAVLEDQFGVSGTIKKDTVKEAHSLEIGNKELWHWLIKNGLYKYHEDEIDIIPEIVRRSSREDILAFIAGLIDADGAIARQADKTVVLAAADEAFARHVQDVGWAVGACFGWSHNTVGENWQVGRKSMYLLTLSSASTEEAIKTLVRHSNKVSLADKEDREWRFDRPGRSLRRIVGKVEGIESIGVMPTFDVEVADNHWFYAGAVKSHNTTSKLYGLEEGAHLPARRNYLRWVQFRGVKNPDGTWAEDADPLLSQYEAKGYPVRENLRTFPGMSIVGFPTQPLITRLKADPDKIVTAPEASPDEQYRWLGLLERHWLGETQANQVSYTLKVYTDQYDLETYRDIVLARQPNVKACSVLPSKPEREMGYEYLPEEEVSMGKFAWIVGGINDEDFIQGFDMETLNCASGACPI